MEKADCAQVLAVEETMQVYAVKDAGTGALIDTKAVFVHGLLKLKSHEAEADLVYGLELYIEPEVAVMVTVSVYPRGYKFASQ